MVTGIDANVKAEIHDQCLGRCVLVLRLVPLSYILFEVLYMNAHLVQHQVSGFAFVDVSSLSDNDWNTTVGPHVCQTCQWTDVEREEPFKEVKYVQLMNAPGIAFRRMSDSSLFINTVSQIYDPVRPSCSSNLGITQAATSICHDKTETEEVPYQDLSDQYKNAKLVIVRDWQRFLLYSSFHPALPPGVFGHIDKSFDSQVGMFQREPIEFTVNKSATDYMEALPAARQKGKPLRSRLWEKEYFSVLTLLDAAGVSFQEGADGRPEVCLWKGGQRACDSMLETGVELQVMVHYHNLRPWHFWGQRVLDYDVHVSASIPGAGIYEGTSDGESLTRSWNYGIRVKFDVSGTIRVFSEWSLMVLVANLVGLLVLSNGIVRSFIILTPKFVQIWPLKLLLRMACCKRVVASAGLYTSILQPAMDTSLYQAMYFHKGPVKLECDPDTMVILDIPSDSRIHDSNRKHPRTAIKKGDRLVQVNGFSRSCPLGALQELKSSGSVNMTIERTTCAKELLSSSKDIVHNNASILVPMMRSGSDDSDTSSEESGK